MDPSSGLDWAEIERLLDQALELAPSDRRPWLEQACSGRPELRREVERLLRGAAEAGDFLSVPAADHAASLIDRVAESQTVLPGERLGPYEIERALGRGGMATIYLARDLRHRRPVAVKVLRPELAAALGAERFLREIEIAARMRHPHILPLFDSGRDSVPDQPGASRLWYVMPYVDGESLRGRLAREHQLPVEDALQISRQVTAALSYAHGLGIIHRDIKPENILLENGEAVVADFGIARAINGALSWEGAEALTEAGLALGTPAYMSPEQALAEDDLDPRTDIYALGCVLYEMLSGEPPFTGASVRAILAKRLSEPLPRVRTLRDAVPQPVDDAIARALARAREERYSTAEEFGHALTQAGGTERRRRLLRLPSFRATTRATTRPGGWGRPRHTIFDGSDRRRLLARLRGLSADRAPRWGRMTAPQMLAHLGDQMALTLQERPCAPMSSPYRFPILRHAVIYWLPWPEGEIQGPPELFTTTPTTWATDLAIVEERVERMATRGPAGTWPDHPMFGRMSGRDWGVFCYRHFDHHLRQFDA